MKPQVAAAQLIWALVGMLDRGVVAGVEEVEDRVEKGELFTWLGSEHGVRVGDEAEAVLVEEFRNLLDFVDAGRKFGVRENGVTLLLAWCIELYQQGLASS